MGSLSTPPTPFNVSRVAVIGAGPGGLAAAKCLSAQRAPRNFSQITVYEQQSNVGGVWNYSTVPPPPGPIPQVDPFCAPDPPIQARGHGDGDASTSSAEIGVRGEYANAETGKPPPPPLFPTAMYDDLETNIPYSLMRYSDLDFLADQQLFPTRQTVQTYLERYAQDVRHLIRFSTSVIDVNLVEGGLEEEDSRGKGAWDVTSRDLLTGTETTERYDALIVASGHYHITYVPDIPGIRAFHKKWPGTLEHSKTYRNAEPYRDKHALLVGNSASGADIASQIIRVAKAPLRVSVHKPGAEEAREAAGGYEEIDEIAEFLPEVRGVRLRDGTVIECLDKVLFCTGYLFGFPFLEGLIRTGRLNASRGTAGGQEDLPLITDGRKVHGLWKHFLHIGHPTLAFLGLPMLVVPFPLMETQADVLARVWTGALVLPTWEQMKTWERCEIAKSQETGRRYHVFQSGGDSIYINGAHDWIVAAAQGQGKTPPFWDKQAAWQRKVCMKAKLVARRCSKAKTFEELGMQFEDEEDDREGEMGNSNEGDVEDMLGSASGVRWWSD